jgi:hypothetical protein
MTYTLHGRQKECTQSSILLNLNRGSKLSLDERIAFNSHKFLLRGTGYANVDWIQVA